MLYAYRCQGRDPPLAMEAWRFEPGRERWPELATLIEAGEDEAMPTRLRRAEASAPDW